MTVFKMIFGAILGILLFFAGKDASEDSDSRLVLVGGKVMMGLGLLSIVAVVLMLF